MMLRYVPLFLQEKVSVQKNVTNDSIMPLPQNKHWCVRALKELSLFSARKHVVKGKDGGWLIRCKWFATV